MEFDKAKQALKVRYLDGGFTLADEHARELYLSYGNSISIVTEEEISKYAALEDDRSLFIVKPNACSICSSSYREQAVQSLDFRLPLGTLIRDRQITFGTPADSGIYATISPMSEKFFYYFLFNDDFFQWSLFRTRRTYPTSRQAALSLWESMQRLLHTIKVFNIDASDAASAERRSSSIIDSCLFELSYLKNIALGLMEEWPSQAPRRGHFRLSDRFAGFDLPLPAVNFNSEVIRYYQLGISTNIPVLQFLAFYQVLEYFFLVVSEDVLYAKLRRRLADPAFRLDPVNLNKIIYDVIEDKSTTDETEMLRRVIEEHVDEGELADFIAAYEKELGVEWYTKRRRRFGVEVEVKPAQGHIIGNIAKILKAVRNGLVHSSDRYERAERHIPFSKSTELVEKEIPLVRFLAEKVIRYCI